MTQLPNDREEAWPGFALPFQVRAVRAWYMREVAWHLDAAHKRRGCDHVDFGDCRPWHLERAADDQATARRIVPHYMQTGVIPCTTIRSLPLPSLTEIYGLGLRA